MSAIRRSPWLALATVMVVVYAIGLLVVSPNFMTTDAAKYVGIGRNVLAGRGAITVFERFFPFHSPTWPVIVMAPEVYLGIEWTVWSHIVQVACAVAVLVMSGFLAARAGPRAALLAVAIFAAFPYGFELARDVGLDEAAAASTLAFVVVALRAGAHRATRWGVLAGLTFGFAFLIKEIVLPFAPLPVLMVLLAGRGWRVALRFLGTFAAVGFAVASWWFVLYASETGTVYRVGTPAWTLVPITVLIGVLLVVGLVVGRDRPATGPDPHQSDRAATSLRERSLVWVAAVGWAGLLAIFFQVSRDDVGNSLFAPAQYAHYLRIWGSSLLPLAVIAGAGSLIAVWQRARGVLGAELATQVDGMLLALISGLPLIMVVVGVGDPPRHYIAQLAILTALGAVGSALAIDRVDQYLLDHPGGLGRAHRWVTPIALSLAVALSGALVLRMTVRDVRAVDLRDQTLVTAIDEVGDWLAAEVGPDDTVAVGSTLSYEIGTRLPADVRVRVVREDQQVVTKPSYPLGIGRPSGKPTDDWAALSYDRHDTDSFYGYSRSATLERLREFSIDVWIEGGSAPPGVAIPIMAALEEATGITPIKSWVWPYRNQTELRLTAYAVDTGALDWRGTSLYLDGATLERLVGGLEAHPTEVKGAARALLERVVIVDGPRPDLLDRLGRIAAGDA